MPQNEQNSNKIDKLTAMFSTYDLEKEERRQLNHLAALLNKQGISRVMLVGGLVRDLYLGRPRKAESVIDVDIIVEGDALEATPELERVYPEAEWLEQPTLHTVRGSLQNIKIDIASARSEKYLYPGAFPSLQSLCSIEEDEIRRDFTINSLRIPLPIPIEGDLKRLVIGSPQALADIAKKQIRIYHDQSFVNDPLRVIRAARYASRLGFEVEPTTRALIDKAVAGFKKISNNRVRTELELLFSECDGVWQLATAKLIVWKFFEMLECTLVYNISKKEAEGKLTELSTRKIQPEIMQQAKHMELWQIRMLLTLGMALSNNQYDKILGLIKWLGGCGNIIHDVESLRNCNWTTLLSLQNTTKLVLYFLIWGDQPENHELVEFIRQGCSFAPLVRYKDFDEPFLESHDFKTIIQNLWLVKFRQPELGINTKEAEIAWITENEGQKD